MKSDDARIDGVKASALAPKTRAIYASGIARFAAWLLANAPHVLGAEFRRRLDPVDPVAAAVRYLAKSKKQPIIDLDRLEPAHFERFVL